MQMVAGRGRADPLQFWRRPAHAGRRRVHPFRACWAPERWSALPAAVRAPLRRKITAGRLRHLCRRGRRNAGSARLGWLLANLARLVGAPLPLAPRYRAFPRCVSVTEDIAGGGQFWTRQYGRARRLSAGDPQRQALRRARPGSRNISGLGIGIALRLAAEDGVLCCSSAIIISCGSAACGCASRAGWRRANWRSAMSIAAAAASPSRSTSSTRRSAN